MDIEVSPPNTVLTRSTLKTATIWFLLVVLAIAPLFPVSNFVGHPHWSHVRWIPFQDFWLSRNMLKDVIGNTLWFMVFGYLLHDQLTQDSRSSWGIALVTAITGCLSLSTELFQVFCHNRISSMTDVTCNVLGASLGGHLDKKLPVATSIEPWLAKWFSLVSGQEDPKGPASTCRPDRSQE